MKKILVIDDADDVRAVVVRSLKDAGFSTLEAADGTDALKLCITAAPDLILCDVSLPDMDGYQTLAAIREIPHFAMVPFILMTGFPDVHGFRRGMISGADDYLSKPFTPDELVQSVVSRLVRQMELEYEASERAKQVRAAAVHQYSEELSDPINGLLGAVTSIMVDYACVRPEAASDGARQINESAQRLNQLAQRWSG